MSTTNEFERLSNWGRWGPDDELGTLNLIDNDAIRRGLSSAKHGEVVSLARIIDPRSGIPLPSFAQHHMLYDTSAAKGVLDSVDIAPHGLEITHIDALGHNFHNGQAYGGRPSAELISFEGLAELDVAVLAGGIVTRGVLLDIPKARGVRALTRTDVVTSADLDRALELTGLEVLSGDAVVVRTGIELQPREHRHSEVQRTGVDASCVVWFRERDVAVYAGDCIEALPSPGEYPMPLHTLGLVSMGLTLIDAPFVEPLAQACDRLDQYEFLFVCGALPLKAASGSAVNPLAIL